MKLIGNVLLVTALLALHASAQPAPPPPSTAPKLPPAQGPGAGPGRMPPGLMHPQQPTTPPVMPDKEKLGYAIGFNIGSSAKKDGFDVDADAMAAAMKDIQAGRPTKFTEAEVKKIIADFQGAMRAKMTAEREKSQAENKAKGEEFLAKNGKEPGVTTLTNGLQYKVIKAGTGEMPKLTDTVTVNYKGSLIDGTVFDQKDGFTTPVKGRTIKGWTEILPLMKTGSKWEVAIPADLGYGPRGMQPKIGPNSVLVFDMELVSIAPPAPAPAPGAAAANAQPRPATPGAATQVPHGPPPTPPGTTNTPVVSGQIIMVPSADDLKKGKKIEVITNVPSSQ
jgi:FKBP-type peptidyl-prolyl cis-trans isomerase FklB